MSSKRIIIVGAGPAGLAAAGVLARLGASVTLIDKDPDMGGHLSKWHQLFPDRSSAQILLEQLVSEVPDEVSRIMGREVIGGNVRTNQVELKLDEGTWITGDGLLLATGFDLFDAHRKEEYGYGIYDNVYTQAEVEQMFENGRIENRSGKIPQSIAFLHCVGSRDQKVGVSYCSKVCCVTGVKQAIEMREKLPDAIIYNFYMDLRMFGQGFEELYHDAQEKYNIRFIRGRISEAAENQQGKVIIKAEDTLTARPLKLTVDMLILLCGMQPSKHTANLADTFGFTTGPDGFLKPLGPSQNTFRTRHPHVMLAGACTGPATLTEAIQAGRSASLALYEQLFNIIN